MITVQRYHDISCGHRVFGHESKCAHLHGHNYRFHFTIAGKLDSIGRVLDFSVIKSHLCEWLEENYDHKFLIWENDVLANVLKQADKDGVMITTFNPTAENIAKHFTDVIAPKLLQTTGCKLIKCQIDETRKCSAIYEIKG